MLGTRQLAQRLARVDDACGKLVVVGDPRQLPAIEAGGILGALSKRLPIVELLDNRRQQEAWERKALALLRDGDTDEALSLYEGHGAVSEWEIVPTRCSTDSSATGTRPTTRMAPR